MSKAERLHRWADSLELRQRLHLEAKEEGADATPLSVAFEDWAFEAEGLRGEGAEEALAFFDLSVSEIQRVIGSGWGSGQLWPAVAAARVRALARRAETVTAADVGEPVAGPRVLPSVPSDPQPARFALGRRRTGRPEPPLEVVRWSVGCGTRPRPPDGLRPARPRRP